MAFKKAFGPKNVISRFAYELLAQPAQGLPGHALVERRGHSIQLGLIALARLFEDALDGAAPLGNEYRHHPLTGNTDERNVAQDQTVETRRAHETQLMGALRKHPRRHLGDARAAAGLETLRQLPLFEGAQFDSRQQLVHEATQTEIGRNAASRAMRLRHQAEPGEFGEGVAHTLRREPNREHVGDGF